MLERATFDLALTTFDGFDILANYRKITIRETLVDERVTMATLVYLPARQ